MLGLTQDTQFSLIPNHTVVLVADKISNSKAKGAIKNDGDITEDEANPQY